MGKFRISLVLFVIYFRFIIAYNTEYADEYANNIILPDNPESYRRRYIEMADNGTFIVREEYIMIEQFYSSNTTDANEDKIINGSPAAIRKFNYQVSVVTKESLCGGCLIRYRWVVTAQHCVVGHKAEDFKIRAGSRTFYKGGVLASVDLVVKHGGYKNLNNDIAMLRMPIGFHKYRKSYPIKPIKPILKIPPDGAKCVTSGFGIFSSANLLPLYLQKAVQRIVNFSECNKIYGGSLTKNMVCANIMTKNKGTCKGDSGGPLVHRRKLVGLTSFGIGVCTSISFPGVYVRIPAYINWIRKVLKKF